MTTAKNNTPVKNEKNEYFHLSCADQAETLTILKSSEFDPGVDMCSECDGILENAVDEVEMEEKDDDE